ncbi:hypothetical protein KSP40_PGU022681 [Platanthera guangdongensis]|uniref:Uncharacterized protein n=1 Tax=Platanthera guangdongensis TaxID=2320717 RepID=A0ABR2M094_9ASPA
MIKSKKLSKIIWVEAIQGDVYLLSRYTTKSVKPKTSRSEVEIPTLQVVCCGVEL